MRNGRLPGTPFHSRTSVLCQAQNWRRWAGYLVAGSYELAHEHEYYAIRNAAGLIDISPLYKYRIEGPDAVRFLNRVVTRDVARCAVGQVLYTPWCNEAGKVLDDGTLQRLGLQTFRLTAADPNLRWLQQNAWGFDVTIADESEAVAALALQGPTSRAILNHIVASPLDDLRYFHVRTTEIQGMPVTISRTGYTGDLGYEIWLRATDAEAVWDTLMAVGAAYGITPAGLLALDMARIEAGLLLIEVDYISARHALIDAQTSSPFELGLGWTVNLEKGPFVGRPVLRAEKQRGPAWQLVGIVVEWASLERLYAQVDLPPQLPAAAWRTSVPLYHADRQIGYATSGCWSPILKKYIALAHVESAFAQPGTQLEMEVTVEHCRQRADVRVVPRPFFDPDRKRL